MKKILVLITLISIGELTFGQEQKKGFTGKVCDISSLSKAPPLFIINDKYVLELIDILNPDDIKEVSVFKNNVDSLIKIYGNSAKDGIAKVYSKDNIELLNLNETLSQLNIKQSDRDLDIYVNDKKILNRDQFVATKSWIKKVEATNKYNNGVNKIRYINLKTTL